ncbi:MAG: TlpA family protein disulfide reductase [Acidimicrobiia bacterium]|nr:TlpA family protein disulfide reductase [Acidimicrobiia bacterium]MDH3396909.1 TlpA family protein disulfide reductase [Acidimicrobiia bacterium]MDH5616260.1 TlpA family protein disulfide reductase [Acidimicrobiia bacterium]
MTDPAVTKPARRLPSGVLPVVGILAVVALLVYVFNSRFGQDPRLVDSPLIGQPVSDLTFDYLEQDGTFSFFDQRGTVLVVNFWASWCFPCRLEHDDLTSTALAYQDRGVHFLGIVYQDKPEQASAFLDEFGRGSNYSYVVDPESRATVELGVFGVPETYIIDADGIIQGKIAGEVHAAVLQRALDQVLEGQTPDL